MSIVVGNRIIIEIVSTQGLVDLVKDVEAVGDRIIILLNDISSR